MIYIDETLLREAIEQEVKYWRDTHELLDISDFDLKTLSASLSGFIQGYCGIEKESEAD
jgi:hypothetical protein